MHGSDHGIAQMDYRVYFRRMLRNEDECTILTAPGERKGSPYQSRVNTGLAAVAPALPSAARNDPVQPFYKRTCLQVSRTSK